jgi:hypothetical protein
MRAEPDEIVLPERKPALEWIGGRAVQKVSPQYTHAALQARVLGMLGTWAEGTGRVGPEWRFRLAPRGDERLVHPVLAGFTPSVDELLGAPTLRPPTRR